MGQFVLFAIACLALFAILAAAAVWVRFQIDQPAATKKPHPIRLTVIMLIGAGFGSCFMGAGAGRGYEEPTVWERVVALIYVVGGALCGIATELLVRWGQRD
jgi:hypothetical protein